MGNRFYFLSGGFYYNQVKRFLEVFPKEQVFICLYDDFKKIQIKQFMML